MTYTPVPLHPPVRRDLSLVVPHRVTHCDILDVMTSVGGGLLDSAVLIDVYVCLSYERKGLRGLTYHLTFRASDRTLTADEVNAAEARILAVLEALGVTRRA